MFGRSWLEKLDERACIKVEVYKLILTYEISLVHFTFLFSSPVSAYR